MFRCMVMSQFGSLKCTFTELCTTDVHEIVSISPHNLVYAILICPHRRLHIRIASGNLPGLSLIPYSLYFYLIPLSMRPKNLQSTTSYSSPSLFIVRSKMHPDLCVSHKIYQSHCQFPCAVAIQRAKRTHDDYAISLLQN